MKDRRFPNTAAEQFLGWLETQVGNRDAADAISAVLAAERKAMAERIERRLPNTRHYHGATGTLDPGEVLTATRVLSIIREEAGIGTEPERPPERRKRPRGRS